MSANPDPPARAMDLLDVGLLGLLGVLWGSAYLFIRGGIVDGASPLLYAAVRYVLSGAIFGALALLRRETVPSRRALWLSGGIGGTLVIGFYGGLLYWGEQYTTGGYASVLAASAPILTVLVAYLLLSSERLGPLGIGGIAVGFVGVLIVVYPTLVGTSVGSWPGPVFVLAAFLSTAVGTVLLRRMGAGRQGLWHLAVQFAVGSAVLAIAMMVAPGPERLPGSFEVLASLAALVVFSSIAGYFVYFTLHHRVGPVRANVVAYLLPLVGVGIGSGFYGEPVNTYELLGSIVVIVGVTLVVAGSFGRGRPEPVSPPPSPR